MVPDWGRDAAAIAVGERVVVAKNDPITFASEGGAAHLVEVNANDVACMGATPRWLLVTALLPHGVTPADVLNQFAELRETCRHRSVELIGGHTEIVPGLERPILVGMMLGDASPDELLRPGQARPGDASSSPKGLAIEGTALLARERADSCGSGSARTVRAAARLLDNPESPSWPRPRLLAAPARSPRCTIPPKAASPARCASWRPSQLGVEIDADAVPILDETRAVADALGIDPLGMLASGSLLIAAPGGGAGIVRDIEAAGIPVTCRGTD